MSILSTQDEIEISEMFYGYSRGFHEDLSIKTVNASEMIDEISMDYHGCTDDLLSERINDEN